MFDSPGFSPATPNAPSGSERRKHIRYPASRSTCCYLATGAEILFPDHLTDVSAGGVGLVVDRSLPPGTIAHLDLYNISRDFPFQIPIRVVYTLNREDSSFALGCVFNRELNNSELWGLL
jgi:hypothetical protein